MSEAEFLTALAILCRQRPVGRELDAWYAEAQCLIDEYKARREWSIEFSEWMWHFLSDADIRAKDPDYAETQYADLETELAELRNAVLRPETGHS